MTTYTLSRDAYELLVDVLGEKQKAETLVRALERTIQTVEERANEEIVEKKGLIKVELKDELRQELVTRELFEERFKVIYERFNAVDERFKSLESEHREQRRETGEFRQEVNERFDRMHERFDQMYQHFETLFDRQNRHAETRFDGVNARLDQLQSRFDDRITGQTRWMVGTIIAFGTLITGLLALSQFAP